MRRLRLPSPATIIALVALVIASTGAALAAIPGPNGVINGCLEEPGAPLTIRDSGEACPDGYTEINFNAQGPAGAPGPTGASGAKGDTGPAGPTGKPALSISDIDGPLAFDPAALPAGERKDYRGDAKGRPDPPKEQTVVVKTYKATAVCDDDDPSGGPFGVGKLLFSLPECLPKVYATGYESCPNAKRWVIDHSFTSTGPPTNPSATQVPSSGVPRGIGFTAKWTLGDVPADKLPDISFSRLVKPSIVQQTGLGPLVNQLEDEAGVPVFKRNPGYAPVGQAFGVRLVIVCSSKKPK